MRIDEYNSEDEGNMKTRMQKRVGLPKDTRLKRPKHANKNNHKRDVHKGKLKNKFTPSGKKIHSPDTVRSKIRAADVEEDSQAAAKKRKFKAIRNKKYSPDSHTSDSLRKTQTNSGGTKIHPQDVYNRQKAKAVGMEEEKTAKKVPSKRNPVQKNMFKTGKPGVHDKDKKGYSRKEKHKKNTNCSASIYD